MEPADTDHPQQQYQSSPQQQVSESDLECPICMSLFRYATDLSCGHSFCAECISRQIRELANDEKKCPVCRARITTIHPSYTLRRVVDAYKVNNPERAAALEREHSYSSNGPYSASSSSPSLPDLDIQQLNEELHQSQDIPYRNRATESVPNSGNIDSILAACLVFSVLHLWDPLGLYTLKIDWLRILLDWVDEMLIIFWIGFFVMRALASFDVPLR